LQYDLTHPEQREQAKDDIVCILAHLFTQKLVSIHLFNEKNGVRIFENFYLSIEIKKLSHFCHHCMKKLKVVLWHITQQLINSCWHVCS
jgi:hypothetical protein